MGLELLKILQEAKYNNRNPVFIITESQQKSRNKIQDDLRNRLYTSHLYIPEKFSQCILGQKQAETTQVLISGDPSLPAFFISELTLQIHVIDFLREKVSKRQSVQLKTQMVGGNQILKIRLRCHGPGADHDLGIFLIDPVRNGDHPRGGSAHLATLAAVQNESLGIVRRSDLDPIGAIGGNVYDGAAVCHAVRFSHQRFAAAGFWSIHAGGISFDRGRAVGGRFLAHGNASFRNRQYRPHPDVFHVRHFLAGRVDQAIQPRRLRGAIIDIDHISASGGRSE